MKKALKAGLILALVALAALWGWRVYAVNHDPVVEYARRKTVEVAPGETADLVAGEFLSGWLDLTGYHVKVTGARLMNTLDLLREHGYDESFFKTQGVNPDYTLVLLVDAVFWYDGEGDPQDNPVILSNFKVVGDNWNAWFSCELDGLGFLNPELEGNSVFAIVSGKELSLTLPFLLNADQGGFMGASMSGLTPESVRSSSPRLLLAEYPTQIYAYLPEIAI